MRGCSALLIVVASCACTGAPTIELAEPIDAGHVEEAALSSTSSEKGPFPGPWGDCQPRTWRISKNVGGPYDPPWRGSEDALATLLPDGRVLLGHGRSIYDPAKDTYERLAPLDSRLRSTATLLADGKSVLLAGGDYGWYAGTRRAEILDLETKKFRVVAPMLAARSRHSAIALPSGKALVIGGTNEFGDKALPQAEVYDPATNTWTKHPTPLHLAGGPLAPGAARAYVAELPGERWFVTSETCEAAIFDGPTESWTKVPYPEEKYQILWTTTLQDGRVLVAGAGSCDGADRANGSRASVLDPSSLSWTSVAPPPRVVGRHGAVVLPCGALLLVGSPALFEPPLHFIYHPSVDLWFQLDGYLFAQPLSRPMLLPDSRVLLAHGQLDPLAVRVFPLFFEEAGPP